MKVTATYHGGYAATVEARGHTVEVDEPVESGGEDAGFMPTELLFAPEFYYAEDDHQQYLAKNPNGHCGLGGTGVRYVS